MKILLDAGVNPNTFAGMSGVTWAIDIAAWKGDLEAVSLLLAQKPSGSDMIQRAMKAAANSGHRTLFEALLKYGKDHHYALQCAALGG